ncbi:MAG: class I SAM-dependent methyltransferase [Ignavibacteriae bacterium]|nr:MAG: class I SAM-dependent methyltransferase [Ignavibacteriota bacterium]
MLKIFSLRNYRLFKDVYKNNSFKGTVSVSGPGSDLNQTKIIRGEIPKILNEIKAKSLLDIPCGDFLWMNLIYFKNIQYIGGDIVKDLIKRNINLYGNANRKFISIDLVNDALPNSDILLCRDCLVHLSFKDIFKVINNLKNSKITYFLTTSFTDRKNNIDIKTGLWRSLNFQWRPLNLLLPPFNFPKPIKIINEQCTENGGKYSDKCLILWRVDDLPVY